MLRYNGVKHEHARNFCSATQRWLACKALTLLCWSLFVAKNDRGVSWTKMANVDGWTAFASGEYIPPNRVFQFISSHF